MPPSPPAPRCAADGRAPVGRRRRETRPRAPDRRARAMISDAAARARRTTRRASSRRRCRDARAPSSASMRQRSGRASWFCASSRARLSIASASSHRSSEPSACARSIAARGAPSSRRVGDELEHLRGFAVRQRDLGARERDVAFARACSARDSRLRCACGTLAIDRHRASLRPLPAAPRARARSRAGAPVQRIHVAEPSRARDVVRGLELRDGVRRCRTDRARSRRARGARRTATRDARSPRAMASDSRARRSARAYSPRQARQSASR